MVAKPNVGLGGIPTVSANVVFIHRTPQKYINFIDYLTI